MSSLGVGVVGAGIVGLSAAINVQMLIRRVKVTVLADSFGRDTYTPVNPGIFLPIPTNIWGVDRVTASEWLIDSWKHHYAMAKSPEGKKSGQTFMSGHYLWSKHPGPNLMLPDLVKEYHQLTSQEMEANKFSHRYGASITTVVIDQIKYLGWLMKEFRERGGQVISDTVYSMQEVYGQFDVVINCTGNRGRETVQDPYFVPVKGYVVQVAWRSVPEPQLPLLKRHGKPCASAAPTAPKNDATYSTRKFEGNGSMPDRRLSKDLGECVLPMCDHPSIGLQSFGRDNVVVEHECPTKKFMVTDDPMSVIPYADSDLVDVGYILEPEVYSQEKNEETVELLLNKVKAFVPSLRSSTVVESYASRRPYRTPPLINIEMVNCGGPILPVVHNIGLGMEAATYAWGMGAAAAHLVQDVQRQIKPFPHICQPFHTLS